MRQRHGAAAELALHQREIEMGEPAAAHLLGEVAGVEAHLEHLALDLGAISAGTSPVRSTSASCG
jgi:hypothetical protein